MREAVLRDFFLGKTTVAELRRDLIGAVMSEGNYHWQRITDMEGEYRVTTRDLVKLCEAVLSMALEPESIEHIGFCLMASDHFEWDNEIPDGEIVAQTVADWSAPEINYPLTLTNIEMFRARLLGCELIPPR